MGVIKTCSHCYYQVPAGFMESIKQRKWRVKNKERLRKYHKKWVNQNRERLRQYQKQYQKEFKKKRYGGMVKTILERDNHECQICGQKEHLGLHHYDGNRKNNSYWNLLTLCPSCHRSHHHGMF